MRMGQRCWAAGLAGLVLCGGVPATAAPEAAVEPIVVKAVAFSAQGGGEVTAHERTASPAYIHEWCTTGHWLEWTIPTADAGEYRLTLRYAAKAPTAREIQVNGRPVQGLESATLASTGQWTDLGDFHAPVAIPLTRGKNVLRLTCLDNEGLWLYQLKLTRGAKSIPIDPASFTGQGGGRAQAIVSDVHGFFSMWDKKGQAFEWTIPAASAGDYTLTLAGAASDVPLRELQINGQPAPGLESFMFPCTGGWRNWCEAALPAKVHLKEGRNVLRMANIESSLNLTYLRLSAPGKPEIFINALDFSSETGGKAQIHTASESYLSGWDGAGQWLEWRFDAAAAGVYNLTLRYMPPPNSHHGIAPSDTGSPREFRINGSVVKGLEVYIAPGATEREWREVQLPAPVALKAGVNVLRITSLDKGPLYLFQLRFTPAQNP